MYKVLYIPPPPCFLSSCCCCCRQSLGVIRPYPFVILAARRAFFFFSNLKKKSLRCWSSTGPCADNPLHHGSLSLSHFFFFFPFEGEGGGAFYIHIVTYQKLFITPETMENPKCLSVSMSRELLISFFLFKFRLEKEKKKTRPS